MERTIKFSFKKFIFSIVFNGAVLAASLILFTPFFEEIDDTNIAMIVEGAFGKKEWHIIYPNVILGRIYVALQNVFANVKWHVILQYVFIYIAYVSLVYVISKHKRGIAVSIVAVLASFYELYVSIQYTKTAAFVCTAGYILIFEYVRNVTSLKSASDRILVSNIGESKRENRGFVITAIILIVYGALLRPEAAFIAGVAAFGAGVLELFRTKNIKKYIVLILHIFAGIVLLTVINSYVYSLNDEWSKFMDYNRARMELNDYRYDIFDFTKYSEELNSLQVSENDALAILTYQYADDEVFSYDRFTEIRAPFPARVFGYTTFANLYENLINEFLKAYAMLVGLIGVILMLLASIITDRSKSSPGYIKDSRRKLFCMLLMGVSCAAAIVYFQYSGRFSHRLMGAIAIPAMFFAGYIIDSTYIKDNDSKIIFGGNKSDITLPLGIVLSLIVVGLNVMLYSQNAADYIAWNSENGPILRELSEIEKDKESLFIADTFTFQNVYKYEVFNVVKEDSLSNFVTCGSWYVNSPITKQITKKYGYENPFDALRSGDDNVYLLDNMGVECKTLFLTEHYDSIYKAEKLEKRGGIDVFHIAVEE